MQELNRLRRGILDLNGLSNDEMIELMQKHGMAGIVKED